MAPVRIATGPIESSLYARHVPREQWPILIGTWADFCRIHLLHDCRELLRFVTEARENRMWEVLGLPDEESFIRRGLDLDPVEVEWALEGLKRRKPKEAVPFEQAITEGRSYTRKEAGALGGRGHKAIDNIKSFPTGTAAAYFVRRLKRDHPEIAAALGRGEYRSARAAAIAAGIITPPTNLERAQRAYQRLTPDEQAQFRQWLAAMG